MIYVEILGRMGNQMFSYAFARYLQIKYPRQRLEKIAFDFSNFMFSEKDKLSLSGYKCTDNIINAKRHLNLLQRILLKMYFKRRLALTDNSEPEIDKLEKKWRDVLNIFGIYLCSFNYYNFKYKPITKNFLVLGYYESSNFFSKIRNVIRDEFSPKECNFSHFVRDLIKDIEISNSVCIGVRRGDFESPENKNFCSVCSNNYYIESIKIMSNSIINPKFFVFTDDPKWCLSNILLPKNTRIIGDDYVTPDIKLYIMSKCKHFIISNSTYIWWAQELSENSQKIVIAPNKWRNIFPEMHMGIYGGGGR